MTDNIAFIFPGQGSQHIGMGEEIIKNYPLKDDIMGTASQILGFDLEKLCLNGPEERLNNTRNTQPAVYTISYLLFQVLLQEGVKPKIVAGHSLGEYSALAAADVFSFIDGLRLVRQRGILMDDVSKNNTGTMAAVIGLEKGKIDSICNHIQGVCEIANYNTPEQTVISGEKKAVDIVTDELEKEGAKKIVKLKVSGPFHSSMMSSAREMFRPIIKGIKFKKPEYKFIANVNAGYVDDPDEIKNLLIRQITESVRWVETVQLMINDGYNTFIEVGPGRVLKGLLRRIDRSVKVYNFRDAGDLRKVIDKIK
ncbi:MAG: ACP S-malonyltransferase [Halanaerobiaceae bacterium]